MKDRIVTRRGGVRGVALVALVALSALVSGCVKLQQKRALDELGAPVKANFAALTAIGAKLAAVPAATSASVAPSSPVVMISPYKGGAPGVPDPTATVVYAEDIAELAAPQSNSDRIMAASLVPECASLVAKGTRLGSSTLENAHAMKGYLKQCATLRTVFVLRTRTKEGRRFVGDVVAFDLATGKHLGGFPLDIQSQSRTERVENTTKTYASGKGATARERRKVRVTTTTTVGYANADASQLKLELSDAVEDGIAAAVPGAQLLD